MADVKKVHSVAKGVPHTPRKVGVVASLVRGRSVADALVILENTPRRAAKAVYKTVASAKANAVSTHGLDQKSLVLDTIMVTPGTRLKRFRPAAMGRALPYQKRTSHITAVVRGTEKPKKPAATKKADAKTEEDK